MDAELSYTHRPLELNRAEIPDGRVPADGVLEALDIIEQVRLGLIAHPIGFSDDVLGFQRRDGRQFERDGLLRAGSRRRDDGCSPPFSDLDGHTIPVSPQRRGQPGFLLERSELVLDIATLIGGTLSRHDAVCLI